MGEEACRRKNFLAVLLLPAALVPSIALAEPVLDRALSGASVIEESNCSIMRVGFNFRVRYQNHFPSTNGRELRIIVRPIDRNVAAAEIRVKREAVRPPKSRQATIDAIDLEVGRADGLALYINFAKPVHFKVAQGADFTSVVVAMSGRRPSPSCNPEFSVGLDPSSWSTSVSRSRRGKPIGTPSRSKRSQRTLTAAETKKVTDAMTSARRALTKKEYRRAIQLLTKVLSFPENEHSRDAQELLGLARERNGQIAHGKAEYEAYLQDYPDGEGAGRVRQRLSTLLTAHGKGKEPLRKGKNGASSNGYSGTNQDGTHWSVSGSLSQFYYRDESYRTEKDPSRAPDPNDDPDDRQTYQNVLISGLDLNAKWGNADYGAQLRFAGSKSTDFQEETDDYYRDFSIASLFFETEIKDWRLLGRVGRQTRNTGGILGRFDGALLSYQINELFQVNGVIGKPVNSRKDPFFEDDRVFYGASLDVGPISDKLDLTFSFVEQQVYGMVDRRSLGAEMRYFDHWMSTFGQIDYDVYFNVLNAAIFNQSWTFADKSTLTVAADYRKSPFLSTTNALYGQPIDTIRTLLGIYTEDEIFGFAKDRTATARSATLGYTRPLTELLQVNFDVTWSNISETQASGGIEATPSTGDEFFYSTQLIGTNVVTNGDVFLAGFRYADRSTADYYVIDLNTRYPLSREWRLNPRLRFTYRDNKFDDFTEYAVIPSLTIDYSLTKYLSLETEFGGRFANSEQGTTSGTERDFFFIFGMRYDLYADSNGRRDGLYWFNE
jgi:hypothetical protein